MKLDTLRIMASSLWLGYTIASPITTPSESNLEIRSDHCVPPGEYMCALLIRAGVFGFPWPGQDSAYRIVDIVNGDCGSILSSYGDLPGTGHGFEGTYSTTYDTQLVLWADSVVLDDFQNVNFLYNNQDWYYQSGCQQSDHGFDPVYTLMQCNFSC